MAKSIAVPEEVDNEYVDSDQEAYDRMDEEEEQEDEEDILEEELGIEEGQNSTQKNVFGVWDSEVATPRLKVMLYGVSGTGKTTMAATFPRPVFLDMEGGMLSVRKYSPLRYPADPNKDIKNYSQVVDFIQLVRSYKPGEAPFETIVLDSLNELQILVSQYIVQKYTKVKRQYHDQLTLADYGKANRDFAKLVRLFIKMPYHVVFTAMSTQKESGDDSDIQIMPKFTGKQVGPDVQRMMDMIGYCHAKRMKDGSSEHYVSFHITPQYIAKDRLGIVSKDIPNNYASLISSTKGEQ